MYPLDWVDPKPDDWSSRFWGRVESLPRWFGPSATAAAAMCGCVALALRDPREEGSFGTCPWLMITGTHCAGCGTLRTVGRLLDGDLGGAATYNVLTLVTIPVMIYTWIRWALPSAIGDKWPRLSHARGGVIRAIAAVIMVFWIGRNLPWEPFSWFAPPS